MPAAKRVKTNKFRICSKCKESKDESDFQIRRRKVRGKLYIGLRCECRACEALRKAKFYATDKGKETNYARQRRNKAFVQQYKADKKCLCCGESCGICLDFHHLDPTTKRASVSRISATRLSIEVILEEIAKCIILCSNCHRKLHAGLIEIPS